MAREAGSASKAGLFRRGPFHFKSRIESVYFTTVKIDGAMTGTSFVVRHEWIGVDGEKKAGAFLVTNNHIVGDSRSGSVLLTVVEEDGTRRPENFEIPEGVWAHWCGHPDGDIDVCVLPFSLYLNSLPEDVPKIDYNWFDSRLAPSEEAALDIGLIEDVLFIGYPNGLYDVANNLPLARRGVTATPCTVDYEGKPVFLIDASVFPGSSGSPVFLFNLGGWRSTEGLVAGDRLVFLGVLASTFCRNEEGVIELRESPASLRPHLSTRQMIDVGVVYKSRTVVETIERVLRRAGEMGGDMKSR